LASAMALPAFYILSIGPAQTLRVKRVISDEMFVRIYKPIRPVCDPQMPLGRVLIRYQIRRFVSRLGHIGKPALFDRIASCSFR
jgi:hypothetical protein